MTVPMNKDSTVAGFTLETFIDKKDIGSRKEGGAVREASKEYLLSLTELKSKVGLKGLHQESVHFEVSPHQNGMS